MKSRRHDFDHFVHAFSSPLTALQGAAALLRRRIGSSGDAMIPELLATLERNIARLRRVNDLILANGTLHNKEIVIRLPVAAFQDVGTNDGGQPQQPGEPYDYLKGVMAQRADAQLVLRPDQHGVEEPASPTLNGIAILISDDQQYVAPLAQALTYNGLQILHARHAVEGIDLARQCSPDLIILDADLSRHADLATQVLAEDPDTNMIPLLLLKLMPDESIQPLFPPNRAIKRATEPESVVGIAQEIIRAGRDRSAPQPHILIVDDESDIRGLVALQFESEGYRTTTVSSGTEALWATQRQPFNLIILDLMLPDLDGFTVLGGLRAQPQTALTPIILLSALDAPQEKVRGLQLGADDYVTKPFSGAELSARVHAAMRRSELEGGANPSTRLPGNVTIERAISRRIQQQTTFAVCYADLDNFKAYNDTYSFLKGDAIIQQTAHMLMAAVRACGNPDDFVGHIGGDDFVIITTPDRVAAVCRDAIVRFDEVVPFFYDADTRSRGYIEAVDRQGNAVRFPLVSVSIAVVTNRLRSFSHPGEVAQRSIEPKKLAKRQTGSIYIIDE